VRTPCSALRPLNAIQRYYGSKISWFSIFLTTLTTSLIWVSFPGIILFLFSIYDKTIEKSL